MNAVSGKNSAPVRMGSIGTKFRGQSSVLRCRGMSVAISSAPYDDELKSMDKRIFVGMEQEKRAWCMRISSPSYG
jgi:hypothetical protein